MTLSPADANSSSRLNDRYYDGVCAIYFCYFLDSMVFRTFYSTDCTIFMPWIITVMASNDSGHHDTTLDFFSN